MSQQLVLELSDEVYVDLQQKANAVGLPIADWIVAALSTQNTLSTQSNGIQNSGVSSVLHSVAQQETARQRFRSHAGAVSLGYETGIDNESIDADLAKAYANESEG